MTKFDLCSDRFAVRFPTYELDQKCRVVPGPKTMRLNFNQLKSMLLSKDISLDTKFEPDNNCFLDGNVDMTHNKVAF